MDDLKRAALAGNLLEALATMKEKADPAQGWRPWHGRGWAPAVGLLQDVEVRTRDGRLYKDKTCLFSWMHGTTPAAIEIIAWRGVVDAPVP